MRSSSKYTPDHIPRIILSTLPKPTDPHYCRHCLRCVCADLASGRAQYPWARGEATTSTLKGQWQAVGRRPLGHVDLRRTNTNSHSSSPLSPPVLLSSSPRPLLSTPPLRSFSRLLIPFAFFLFFLSFFSPFLLPSSFPLFPPPPFSLLLSSSSLPFLLTYYGVGQPTK